MFWQKDLADGNMKLNPALCSSVSFNSSVRERRYRVEKPRDLGKACTGCCALSDQILVSHWLYSRPVPVTAVDLLTELQCLVKCKLSSLLKHISDK